VPRPAPSRRAEPAATSAPGARTAVALRLVSIRDAGRDGRLGIVSSDLARVLRGPTDTVQRLLEEWPMHVPRLIALAEELERGAGAPLDARTLLAPVPRAYQWCEGSTYLSHMRRCRAARGAEMPSDPDREPAVLQGASDRFLAPTEPIVLAQEDWDLDLECTLAAVVGDVPQGAPADVAASCIRLLVLVNDLTLRGVLQAEFAKGLGFVQSKPLRAMAPVALTPAALGEAWDGGLLHARVSCWVNGEPLGALDSGRDAAFDFGQVIAHAARTRPLAAGTIVGTGTVSNADASNGFGCLAEKRAMEILQGREPSAYLRVGDTVRIEAHDRAGSSLFGSMQNTVVDIDRRSEDAERQ